MALGIYTITATDKTSWIYTELTTDGFSWCFLLTFNIVIALFLLNLWRNPGWSGRAGQTSSANELQSRNAGRGKMGTNAGGGRGRLSIELSSPRPTDMKVDAFYPSRDGYNGATTNFVVKGEEEDDKAAIFDIVRLTEDRAEEGYAKYERK